MKIQQSFSKRQAQIALKSPDHKATCSECIEAQLMAEKRSKAAVDDEKQANGEESKNWYQQMVDDKVQCKCGSCGESKEAGEFTKVCFRVQLRVFSN